MNKFLMGLSGVMCLASVGCSSSPGKSYTLYIDPSFAEWQQEEALDAAAVWESNVPDLKLSPVVGDCPGIKDGVICVKLVSRIPKNCNPSDIGCTELEPGSWAPGDSAGFGGVDGGVCLIDVAAIDAFVSNNPQFTQLQLTTMEHEMGHAMGLEHIPGSVMGADPFVGTPSVNCLDVEQWYSLRNMAAPLASRCNQ
jgi:hypothetical protein